MQGYVADLESLAKANTEYRRALYTGRHLQLELMALQPRTDMGPETITRHDQFFCIEAGEGEVVIDGVVHRVKAGSAIVVPEGTFHNLRNTGDVPMRVYTIYGPPNHAAQLKQPTKVEALGSHEVFEAAASR